MALQTATITSETSNLKGQSTTEKIDKTTVSITLQDKQPLASNSLKTEDQGVDAASEKNRRELDKQRGELMTLYTQLKILETSRDRVNANIGKLKRLNWKGMNKKAFAENKAKLTRYNGELSRWSMKIEKKVKEIKEKEVSVRRMEESFKKLQAPLTKEGDQVSKTLSEPKTETPPIAEKDASIKEKGAVTATGGNTDLYLDKAKVYDGQGNADLKDKPIESEDEDDNQGLIDEEDDDVLVYTGSYDDPIYDKKEEPHEKEEDDMELAEGDRAIIEKVGLGIAAKGSFNDDAKGVYEDLVKVIDVISLTASFGSKTSYLERYAAIGAPILKTGEDVSNLHNQLVNSPDAQARGFKRTWKMILVGARFLLFMQQQKCLLNAKTVEEFKSTFSGSERQIKLIKAQTLESVSEAVRLLCCIFSTDDRMFVRVPLTPRIVQAHQEYATDDFILGTSYAYIKVPKALIISQEGSNPIPH